MTKITKFGEGWVEVIERNVSAFNPDQATEIEVEINWVAIGSVTIAQAVQFNTELKKAIEFAKKRVNAK